MRNTSDVPEVVVHGLTIDLAISHKDIVVVLLKDPALRTQETFMPVALVANTKLPAQASSKPVNQDGLLHRR